MKLRLAFTTIVLACLLPGACSLESHSTAEPSDSPFLVKPYLQLGTKQSNHLTVIWQAEDDKDKELFQVEINKSGTSKWEQVPINSSAMDIPGLKTREVFRAHLPVKEGTGAFLYRVLLNHQVVFSSQATALKSKEQSFTCALFGDCGSGGLSQAHIAYQAFQKKPNLIVIPGDIVYPHGTFSEYLQKFFPVYNADTASLDNGVPLARSFLFVSVPGNHDTGTAGGSTIVRNLDRFPDALGYFLFWEQPLNGPALKVNGPNTPALIGSPEQQKHFLSQVGSKYPRMCNFSFNYGNSHWLMLDANNYMDWTDPELRSWVRKDLENAQKFTWRFVVFHQAPFTSDPAHFPEQRMRLLCDIFEKGKVNLVFSGHIHNYQRTFPLYFSPQRQSNGLAMGPIGQVDGDFTLDKQFDGIQQTKPDGVIYIITGGGGAGLSGEKYQNQPDKWQPFTSKFIADQHSFTYCEITNTDFTLHQITEDGKEVDSFKITK